MMTGVNLVIHREHGDVTKDGKALYLDVQVDHRDWRASGQTGLHLVSQKIRDVHGDDCYFHKVPYSLEQVEKISMTSFQGGSDPYTLNVAGTHDQEVIDKAFEDDDLSLIGLNGTTGQIYTVKADLIPSLKTNGLVIDVNSLEVSDFDAYDALIDDQNAFMSEASNISGEETSVVNTYEITDFFHPTEDPNIEVWINPDETDESTISI